jgi:hypothetical protein
VEEGLHKDIQKVYEEVRERNGGYIHKRKPR